MLASFIKRCITVFSILLIILSSNVFAQTKKYSLSSLILSAHSYQPVLMQKKALIESSKAFITDTKHSFLPQVKFGEQLDLGSANSVAGSFFTLGITPSTSGGIREANIGQPITSNVAVIYSEYELENFGLNQAKLNTASSYLKLAETDLKKEQYFLDFNIAKLYLNILRNQYRLGADRQNIDRYQSVFKVIQALTVAGIKPGADSSLAKAELSKTKISFNQTLGIVNQLKEQLAYLTGIPGNSISVDSLPINPMNKIPTASDFSMDSINNPLVDFYAKKRDIYVANQRLISKTYLPKILLAGSSWARGSSIQYNDQYKSLSTGLGYQRFNYAVGVAFVYNLFNGITKRDKLAINRYQLLASEYDLQQQKLFLQLTSNQADNALQTTLANLTELPVQFQSAQDTYQQKMAQYKAGIISLIDLTNASFVLYRSQTDYIETLYDWYMSQLDKATATGNLTQFIQTIK